MMSSLPQRWVREPRERGPIAPGDQAALQGMRLTPFRVSQAPIIVRWVNSEQQLRWLAPSTPPPLTAEKVAAWKRPGGEALVLAMGRDDAPAGYGELNPMRSGGGDLWLGHVIVRPDLRGRGVGTFLSRALLSEAFEQRGANRVSLIVFPDNLAALRCYRRAGFITAGEEQHQFGGAGPTHRLLRLEIARPAVFA
jgi:RimJ/RimL family protein N-acetyltransferase